MGCTIVLNLRLEHTSSDNLLRNSVLSNSPKPSKDDDIPDVEIPCWVAEPATIVTDTLTRPVDPLIEVTGDIMCKHC